MLRILLCAALLASAFSAFAQQNYNFQLRSTLTFPGQKLANICGYWQDGREYALVGGSKGLIIVDITNPNTPSIVVQIPGPENDWKEIKTYQHYAYVTSEGGQGVQIVNLKDLPNANLTYHNYLGTGDIASALNRIHALHIDTKKGFLYTYGSQDAEPNGTNGAMVHDLNTDPYNPVFVGKYTDLGYVHDGYADNDTLYACHIYAGQMAAVDMTDKANPKLLGAVETPSKFTHNSWILSDRKTVLTTDERVPSFLTAYDVSDPSDIRELDRVATTLDGLNSIGHNTHILNDWAITSWYSDGLTIVDAHRPDNLVQVARYDTWAPPQSGNFFVGCWGAFPYFPSGTVVASNIEPAQLFVLTPTYVRAAYLEGRILNGCNGQPLLDASIVINSNDPNTATNSNITGRYKTGQATPGSFTVTVSKSGFKSQTLPVVLKTAEVTELNVTLEADNLFNTSIILVDATTQQPIANKAVALATSDQSLNLQTNASGQVALNCILGDTYSVGVWGYLTGKVTINSTNTVTVSLTPGYYDAFSTDLGWKAAATASAGYWALGEPIGTSLQGNACNPDNDVLTDDNNQCYVTGNAGGQAGTDDVDNGGVTLTSPSMLLGAYSDAVLTFSYWFYNGGGDGNPNDKFEVKVLNNGQSATVLTQNVSASAWRSSGNIHLKDFFPNGLSNDVQVQFSTADDEPGHVVEAAVDVFKVVPVTSSAVSDILENARLDVSPNPSADAFRIRYDWPAESNALMLEVRNALGVLVENRVLSTASGIVECGGQWPSGVYFAMLRGQGKQSVGVKMVKQ